MKVYQHNLLMCKLKVQEDPIWVSYQMQWNMMVLTILFLIWNQTDSIRFLSYFFPSDHIFLLFFVTERNSVWFQIRRKIVKTITSHPLLWNPNRFLGMQKWHFLPPRFKKPPKKIWSFFVVTGETWKFSESCQIKFRFQLPFSHWFGHSSKRNSVFGAQFSWKMVITVAKFVWFHRIRGKKISTQFLQSFRLDFFSSTKKSDARETATSRQHWDPQNP